MRNVYVSGLGASYIRELMVTALIHTIPFPQIHVSSWYLCLNEKKNHIHALGHTFCYELPYLCIGPSKIWCDLKLVISNPILRINILSTSCEITLRWMPQDLTDDLSTLVQVMAWCCHDPLPLRCMYYLGRHRFRWLPEPILTYYQEYLVNYTSIIFM